MNMTWAALRSLQLPVGSHTGYKWAELLFATGQTGSSTAQPKEGPFPRKTGASHSLCLHMVCSGLIELLPSYPESQGKNSDIIFEIKTMLMSESFIR